jgi:hypothetical protein
MLVVACALSLRAGVSSTSRKDEISTGVRSGMMAFSVLFGLVVGAFGGLGYTATEVFLDSCAEWMPLALDAEAADREAERTKESKATATTPKEAEAEGAAALSSSPSSSSSTLPAPPEPSCSAAELAAATALRHKFVASRYKNIFASHIYAFVEVGTVAFTLPGALRLVDGRKLIRLLIAVTCCLFAGAVASLFIPDVQDPS